MGNRKNKALKRDWEIRLVKSIVGISWAQMYENLLLIEPAEAETMADKWYSEVLSHSRKLNSSFCSRPERKQVSKTARGKEILRSLKAKGILYKNNVK